MSDKKISLKLASRKPAAESSDVQCRPQCNDCVLTDYNDDLRRNFYNTLRVSAVFDCEVGNAPYIFLEDGEVRGFTVDLLREIVSRIPAITRVVIEPKATLERALDDITIGAPVLDITLTPLTRELSLARPTLGFLAVAGASVPATANQQFLVYRQGDPVNQCDISTIVALPGDIFANLASRVDSCPNLRVFLDAENYIGIDLLDTVPVIPSTQFPNLGAVAFLQFNLPLGNTTQAALLSGLTLSQIGTLQAVGFVVRSTVPVVPTNELLPSLGFGWAFLKHASHFGLWLQRAFDEFVATGGYRDLLEQWNLTASTLNPGSLLAPLTILPRFYSLTTGLIPQVSVYEAYLPKLDCVGPRRGIEIVALACESPVTNGEESEEPEDN